MYQNQNYFLNKVFLFDVENNINQLTSENNDLKFDRFEVALDEAIQRHALGMFEQTSFLSKQSAFHE